MTEKAIRAMLDTAVPAEAPLVMLYLVAAVYDDPPPQVTFSISVSYAPPARRELRMKKKKKKA